MSQVSGQQLDHLAHVETGTGSVHLTVGSAIFEGQEVFEVVASG
jgi:hypothetical protein